MKGPPAVPHSAKEPSVAHSAEQKLSYSQKTELTQLTPPEQQVTLARTRLDLN